MAQDDREHRLDHDTDRCMCGGIWVYFEPYDGRDSLPGVYGCENQEHEDAVAHNRGRDTNDRLVSAD